MTRTRRGPGATAARVGVFAAGVAAGVAFEEWLYRRAFRTHDPEADEPLGKIRGRPLEVIAADGTRLTAEEHGPRGAPTIVLVHGFTLNRALWHYQVRDLRDRFRVITYDARGHGSSGPVRGPDASTTPTLGVLASDLLAVMDAAGADRCVLAGHSLGGMTALELARLSPREIGGRVRGLVLVNSTFTGATTGWREDRVHNATARAAAAVLLEALAAAPRASRRLRMPANDLALFATLLGFGRRPSPSHVAFVHAMVRATEGDTTTRCLLAIGGFEALDVLPTIGVPTLVLAGERDALTPAWLSKEMAERIAGAELVVLPGTGHHAMLERYAEVSRRIAELAASALEIRPIVR